MARSSGGARATAAFGPYPVLELVRTNAPIMLSWLEATLKAHGIGCLMLDAHTSVLEGSIGAIPRRVMVDDGDRLRTGPPA